MSSMNQKLQHKKEVEFCKEGESKFQQKLHDTQETEMEKEETTEKEIRELKCLQEYHMTQLKECQRETDEIKEKEKKLKTNLNELEKELELLEENYAILSAPADFSDAYYSNKVKLAITKRSDVYLNQINLCLSILQRTLDVAENKDVVNNFRTQLEEQLKSENEKRDKIEGMYESEAKTSLRRHETNWQLDLTERYKNIKNILVEEQRLMKISLNETMKKHDALLENRATHISVLENSSDRLKHLMPGVEHAPVYQKSPVNDLSDGAKQLEFPPRQQATDNIIHSQTEESYNSPFSSPGRRANIRDNNEHSCHHNSNESCGNNMCPECLGSKSFINLNTDVCPYSARDLDSKKTNQQREMRVVTPGTEADRPRFGRKHVDWN